MKRSIRWLIIGGLLALLAACGPEDGRQRGAGLGTGADIRNYTQDFRPNSKVFSTQEP